MKKLVILLAFVILGLSSFTVFAQSANQQGGSSVTTSGQQESDSQKCTDVTKKIDLVVTRYNQNQEKYTNAFKNMSQNMEQLALKLKIDGYDTTKLEADLKEFNNMIQNASRYYNEFANGLDNSKKGVCGNSRVDSGKEFTRARAQLSLCKTEMLGLRTFAEEVLRQDLLELKSEIEE